jgi:GTP cyclohydrolase IA
VITPDRKEVEWQVRELLKSLELDLTDPNLEDSPKRIAKMFIDELFAGLYNDAPLKKITTFPNTEKYDQMIVTGPIVVKSLCSHHFLPFIGECYVGYIPKDKLLGLSKFSRVVHHFMRRPQIQEGLTEEISNYLFDTMNPAGCGVWINAQHLCMTVRGVNEPNSSMTTMSLKGTFSKPNVKEEFIQYIGMTK